MKVLKIKDIVRTISITHKFDKDKLIAINTSDVENGIMHDGTLTAIEDLKGQFKKTAQKGDILFSEIRPANRRFALVTKDDCADYVVSTKLMVLRKYNNEVDLRYFYYCLTNQPFLDMLQRKAENRIGSFPQITFDLLSEYAFPVPSLSEQEKIANIIFSLDHKIELNKQINDNLEAMAKQLYDYWFVQFDFPNEEGKPYKSSGGAMLWNEKLKREIPLGWSVLSVNDIAASVRGVSYAKDDMVDSNNGVLVLRGNNIQDNRLIYDSNVAYIPSSFVSENQRIRPLDIIMTMSSGSKEHIGKSAMFQFASEDTFGAFLTKFTAKEHCAYLLFNLFNSKYFKAKIKSIACGTGINNLTNQTFDEIYVVMPEDELLLEFDKRQSQIFAEIGLIGKSNIELTKQRDELLPLLMNGQASVNYHLSDD